jgi:hypothetical protein
MPSVFTQALGQAPGVPGDPNAPNMPRTPYDLAMAQLTKPSEPVPPMFTPEQVQERLAAHNQQMALGTLGQLSLDPHIQGVGGSVFKQALATAEPRMNARGTVFDPLTGESHLSADAIEDRRDQRRTQILEAAIRSADAQARTQEHEDNAALNRGNAIILKQMAIAAAAGKGMQDPEMQDLAKQLKQAQIDHLTEQDEDRQNKRQVAADKVSRMAKVTADRADFLSTQATEALKRVSAMTTGIVGSQMRKVPGTDATNLDGLIKTIKANIGFNELQEMRQASPTGGALGQVAIKELDMLQATLGNMDLNQSPAEVRRSLTQIQTHFKNIKAAMAPAMQAEVPPARPATPIAPPPGAAAPVAPGAAATPSPGVAPGRWVVDPTSGELVRKQ